MNYLDEVKYYRKKKDINFVALFFYLTLFILVVLIALNLTVKLAQEVNKLESHTFYQLSQLNNATSTLATSSVAINDKIDTKLYEITGYCLNVNKMANGQAIHKGAIACPAFLKFGTKVEILGVEYTCEDRMALTYRHGNYIDVWYADCDDAIQFGRRKINVVIK